MGVHTHHYVTDQKFMHVEAHRHEGEEEYHRHEDQMVGVERRQVAVRYYSHSEGGYREKIPIEVNAWAEAQLAILEGERTEELLFINRRSRLQAIWAEYSRRLANVSPYDQQALDWAWHT